MYAEVTGTSEPERFVSYKHRLLISATGKDLQVAATNKMESAFRK
jgi:hypothetical protein